MTVSAVDYSATASQSMRFGEAIEVAQVLGQPVISWPAPGTIGYPVS